MTSKKHVQRQQRGWAKVQGLPVDAQGYLETVEANLRVPLSTRALAAFEDGGGSELRGHGNGPAKMRALHSSAALAVNVFDHWTADGAAPLLDTLGLDSGLKSLDFEAKFETGLPGTPPNLDVALTLASGTVVGIECKFTEWMTPKRASRPAFKRKYFEGGAARWAAQGLPRCQALAGRMMDGAAPFRFLDAAQLLKHALGLATRCERFALQYLYYDVPGPAGEAHAEEIIGFAESVDAGLGFRALSYQQLYSELAAAPGVDPTYVEYLGTRYF